MAGKLNSQWQCLRTQSAVARDIWRKDLDLCWPASKAGELLCRAI